ncbi:MAG TPA: hypothetical protein VFC09_16565 [Candidatus Dormibacteraeota bacterium]|nr:hypothetical protein [Candidatus Dormibacteraeota bacterium]
MRITRSYGDGSGGTRLGDVELAEGAVPAIALRFGPPQKLPFMDFHPAPARGLVVALRGEFEIATTNGDRKRFRQGEWFFADDVGTSGHTFEGFGEEQAMLHCAVPDDWDGWTQV